MEKNNSNECECEISSGDSKVPTSRASLLTRKEKADIIKNWVSSDELTIDSKLQISAKDVMINDRSILEELNELRNRVEVLEQRQ